LLKFETEILPTHTAALFDRAVQRASGLLLRGELVVLPTETVYGLAANALNAEAVQKIYEAKGRPSHNPLIVHVNGMEMAKKCAAEWPSMASEFAEEFWPGPLSMVVARSGIIPDIVTAGGLTVGLRWPSHPFIQAVIAKCGFPLAAPSANLANQVSPTNPGHAMGQLRGRVALIVDGGQCQVGIESTVIDVTVTPPVVLRPGMLSPGRVAAFRGQREKDLQSGELRSPGQLVKHYSPRAKVILLKWMDEADLLGQLRELGIAAERASILAHSTVPLATKYRSVSVIPEDAEAYARALYAEFHACDEAEASHIIVEEVPESFEWIGIRDRLKRASA
jgi:L-threonylcarbamoyladenylate synthase